MQSPSIPTTTWRQLLAEPALVAWVLYLLLIPVYVFKNGLPQPGDIIVFILVPMAIRRRPRTPMPAVTRAFRALVWFTAWVTIVDYAWMLLTGNFNASGPDSFLLYPLYYIYNALVFLAATRLYRRHGDLFLRVTVYAVMATVFTLGFTSLVLPTGTRTALLFNNPNQLGYYALLASTLIAMTHRALKLKVLTASSAMLCCGYLAMISASRAAVGGIAILVALMFFSNPRIIIVTIIATFTLVAVGPLATAMDHAEQRILNRSRNSPVTFFEERGYDRISQHQEYLLLGAGEGGFSRWDELTHVRNMEIHSSAGTIFFSYGIVGSILFLIFAWRVVRRAPIRLMLSLVPPLLYTIAHHGLRFTMLWVLLSVYVVLKGAGNKPVLPDTQPAV